MWLFLSCVCAYSYHFKKHSLIFAIIGATCKSLIPNYILSYNLRHPFSTATCTFISYLFLDQHSATYSISGFISQIKLSRTQLSHNNPLAYLHFARQHWSYLPYPAPNLHFVYIVAPRSKIYHSVGVELFSIYQIIYLTQKFDKLPLQCFIFGLLNFSLLDSKV